MPASLCGIGRMICDVNGSSGHSSANRHRGYQSTGLRALAVIQMKAGINVSATPDPGYHI